MSSEDPETVVFPPERLHRRPLRHIPNPDRLVLAGGEDELVAGVEHGHGHVVKVASAAVDLPRLRLGHAPELDLSVVAARDDEGQGGVERCPVDSAVVALQDVLDDGVGVAEEVGLALVRTSDLLLE